MESKNFSKKSEIILVSLSIFAIFISTLLVIFANQFYTIIYEILSTKVFHREFDFNKWLPSIESFFLIPSFLVITVNALIFTKYSKKSKEEIENIKKGITIAGVTGTYEAVTSAE